MDDEITFELTTFEVASYYAVSESTVRRWCRSGYLPGAVKIWGRMSRGEWQIPSAALDGFEPPKWRRLRKVT